MHIQKKIVTALLFLALISFASAATYYVDAVDGNDSYAGTGEQPWKSWQKAQSILKPGDVAVLTGDFGNITINGTDPVGTSNGWITYMAWSGKPAPKFSYIRFDGTIKDAYLKFIGIYVDPGYVESPKYLEGPPYVHMGAINLKGASYVTFENSYFEGEKVAGETINNGDFAPYSFGPMISPIVSAGVSPQLASYITIKNCTFKYGSNGITASQHPNFPDRKVENWAIVNNDFSKQGEDCITTSVSGGHYIANNYFHDKDIYTAPFCWAGTFTGDWSNKKDQKITQDSTNASGIFYKIEPNSRCGGISGDVIWMYADDKNHLIHRTTNNIWRLDSDPSIYFTPFGTGDSSHSDLIAVQSTSHDILIENNTFNQKSAGSFGGQTIKIEPAAINITFRNNLISLDTYVGAWQILLAGQNTRLYNNTIDTHTFGSLRLICTTSSAGCDSNQNTYFYNNIISEAYYSSGTISSNYNIWGSTPPAQFNEGQNSLVNFNFNAGLFVDRNNFDYHPLISSPACDGSINGEKDVAIGALPCVCTQESQCEQVFGTGYFCNADGNCSTNQSQPQPCTESQLLDYISQWKQGSITLLALMQKMGAWKAGTGCPTSA